jgi:PBP1b-binding outer membrane lipoprotein LpoB
MKKTIIMIALLGIFLAGCTGLTGQKEIKIESGKKNCNEIEKSMVSSLLKNLLTQDCTTICEEKAYNYSRWDCTDDKVVCVCAEK